MSKVNEVMQLILSMQGASHCMAFHDPMDMLDKENNTLSLIFHPNHQGCEITFSVVVKAVKGTVITTLGLLDHFLASLTDPDCKVDFVDKTTTTLETPYMKFELRNI